MPKPIKSRHGLTRCRACRAHIQAADRPSLTDCPFCGSNLLTGQGKIMMPSGRGGILAASLLAFSLTACGGGGESDPPPDDTTVSSDDTSGDDSVASDDGTGDDGAGDDQYDPEPADDNTAVAEYGVAADEYEEDESPDYRPQPRYGLPSPRR